MGKILYTKQVASREKNKVYVDITQRIEYDIENVKNIVHDLKEEKSESKKVLKNLPSLKKKSIKAAKDAFEKNIDSLKNLVKKSDEEIKELLYNDFLKNKEKIMESLKHESKLKRETIKNETARLEKIEMDIKEGIKRVDAGINLYKDVIVENE